MPKQALIDAVKFQQQSCKNIGSPFYCNLLACALNEPALELPFWDALDKFEGNPMSTLSTLRILGALHDLVLSGKAESLAATFPQDDCPGDAAKAWHELNAVIAKHRAFIDSRLKSQVQTNEVRRCAALVPGFLEVSARAGLPLRLAELGASAGLNLCWDSYRYRFGDVEWGNDDALLTLETDWYGNPPKIGPIQIAGRRGCDLSPLDMADANDRRKLQSFIWPDQPARKNMIRRAIRATERTSPDLEKMPAGDFVADVLDARQHGEVTVIYHSIMWMYVPEEERRAITTAIEEAGRSATASNPLAWLRMEFVDSETAALWLDYWPSTASPHLRERLADCHYHGTSVRWYGAGATE
jgi:hypothetical protein